MRFPTLFFLARERGEAVLSALLVCFPLFSYVASDSSKKRQKKHIFLDSKREADKFLNSHLKKTTFFSTGISFLIKEYQQLLADALAVVGFTQPAVELDWLAQHVQYKIQEFNVLLVSLRRHQFFFPTDNFFFFETGREKKITFFQPPPPPPQKKQKKRQNHISPSLASHVSIENPLYTNKPYLAGGTNQTPSRNAWFRNGPQALDITAKGFQVAPNLINIRPCLINVGVTGASAAPRLINIVPRLIQVSTTGAFADPKLFNIQPTLIKIKATGIQLTPRQFNIAPSLIEASPGITIKDDNIPVPKTERFGAPVLDFSGKGATVNAGERMPARKDLPTPPTIPKFNKNALKYQG